MDDFQINIDWEGYYKSFCEKHGEDPITDPTGNYLLFQDGWRYQANRISGPEYPPEDELHRRQVQKQYWELRKKKAAREYGRLRERIDSLRNVQDLLSGTIYVFVKVFDEDLEREVTRSQQVDFDLLEARAEWLRRDEEDATVHLNRILKEEKDAQNSNGQQYAV